MKIQGIIFDKDGTLFDFNKTWSKWAESFLNRLTSEMHSRESNDLKSDLSNLLGYDLNTRVFHGDSVVIADTPEAGINKIKPLLPNYNFNDLLELSNKLARETTVFEVVPLLSFLNKLISLKLLLGVATNDTEESARHQLKNVGVEDLFSSIKGSNSGFGAKPDPEMCLAVCSELCLEPQEVIMVGDSLHDLESGNKAGMITVGVLSGPAQRSELELQSNFILKDISFLPSWLLRNID